jgi:ABC-2 type transport system permease protein
VNWALWQKAIREARALFLGLAALEFGFQWLFIWLSSLVKLPAIAAFLSALPKEFESMAGIPFSEVATPTGRLAMAYVDPVVIFGATCWAVARGSDCISGELGRGTMEMLLSQPVRRIEILLSQAVVTTMAAALLALATWLGTCVGVWSVGLAAEVNAWQFLHGAVNLFALMFFLAGLTTLVSSADSYRGRTIGIVGGFYMVELVIKVLSRLRPQSEWIGWLSFLTAFEPQRLIVRPDEAWRLGLGYNGTLLAFGLAAYVAAAIVFCRRDLPAPL